MVKPPSGVATTSVDGEPSETENIRRARGLLTVMPAGLTLDQQATFLAGTLVSSWRHGYWTGQVSRSEPAEVLRMATLLTDPATPPGLLPQRCRGGCGRVSWEPGEYNRSCSCGQGSFHPNW